MGGGDQKQSTAPWKGYRPYLTGRGAMPDWLMQRPGPASEEWARMNELRGQGASADMMGMTPGDIRDPMGVDPTQWDHLLYGSWNMMQPDMYPNAGTHGIGPGNPGSVTPPSDGGGSAPPPGSGGSPPGGGAYYGPGLGMLLSDPDTQMGGNPLIRMTDGSYYSPGGPVDGLGGDLSSSVPWFSQPRWGGEA